MRFGSAKDLITPPFPTKLACSGVFDRDFLYIHDDVYVRCLVLDDGNSKCVLFSFDLLFHHRCLNRALEAYAAEKYDIPPAAVIVGATHSHVAPASTGYNRTFDNPDYEFFLLDRAKRCLDKALCTMYEGTVEYSVFHEEFNISRRGIVNGKMTLHPAPDRPRDTEFSLLTLRDLSGNVRSIVMNYACHPVFYPAKDAISGEFPARVCQLLDAKYYGCTSLFFQSAGADVRPAATVADGKFVSPLPFSLVDSFAKSICEAVSVRVDQAGQPFSPSLASDAFCLELPLEPQPLAFFQEKLARLENRPDNPELVNARYIVTQGGYDHLESTLPVHCQTLRLAEDLYIATMGGEPTSGVKNAVKASFGQKKVIFIGYTDDCSYLVNDRELAEGGYESNCHLEYCLIGPLKPGLDQAYQKGFSDSLTRLASR
jgi:hypothetical protein